MAKTKILVLVKANPSPFAKEILQYQEELIRENIDLSKVTLCGTYRFIGKELNFNSFKESCIIQKIRARSIDQIMIISKNIISSDISVCNDFEYFCNYYDVSLVEISPLFKLIDETNKITR
ncbi:hypothetical protein [Thomasclavelia spiroformis]|uniref:hypothetical protein n=1 Tax=Thomasclavelia spiroformis TaxID=29348 RepID=UPI00241CC5AB|nr:hypothetical protein [Thomasclavelia spiroformis]MBS6114286.1 hypothetical protein [Thomasclavelia spiroformis]